MLAPAICSVLTAVVALCDPQLIVIGGEWGRRPTVLEAIATRFEQLPRHVPVRAAVIVDEPALTGPAATPSTSSDRPSPGSPGTAR